MARTIHKEIRTKVSFSRAELRDLLLRAAGAPEAVSTDGGVRILDEYDNFFCESGLSIEWTTTEVVDDAR